MKKTVHFTIYGKSQPAGSKRAFPYKKKDGSGLGVRVSDANPNARSWKQDVASAAVVAMKGSDPFQGPLELTVDFHRLRPKGHLGTRGVLPSAPSHPITKPDTTKLLRGLEDALSGIAWKDDAQVVIQTARKLYTQGPERTEVWIIAVD